MLSDKQLVGRLVTLCRAGHRIDLSIVLLLKEVEDRRLELRSAYPSLYEFCRQELGMSEGTTHRRTEAVRLVRRIPQLVEHLKRGPVTLSAVVLLKNHITEANHEELLAKVAGKTRKQIEVIIAEIAPRPDVAAKMRKLPDRSAVTAPIAPATSTLATTDGSAANDGPLVVTPPALHPRLMDSRDARLEPLAPSRWKLQLTASQELHDKLERLQTLMSHKNPSGDLAVIVEAAVDRLLADLEKKRGVISEPAPGPAKARRPVQDGEVSAATRRAVFKRDGEQCTFVGANGRRCGAKRHLHIDHIDARGKGGAGVLENLRLRCRAHNKLHAEEDYGREYIAKRIAERTSRLEVRSTSRRPTSKRSRKEVESLPLDDTGS